jgi:hypothetical protein
MTKFTLVLAASAALLAGPAIAAPGQIGSAPLADLITPAQFSIEIGPNHSRYDSRRHDRWESRGHRRWESRGERRCRTVTEHRSSTSRSRTFERCD